MLRVIKPEDTQRICLFGAQVFCVHEPMCKALGPTVSEFVEQFTPVVEACCSSGLSYMLAADTASKDGNEETVISMSLALPYAQYKALELDDHPTFRPVLAVFDALDDVPYENEAAGVMNFMWATMADHMNKGYARKVVDSTMRAAQQAGYGWLVADATNVVSQHVMTYFGYQPFKKVRYHDFDAFKVIACTEFVIRAVRGLADGQDQHQQDQQGHGQQEQQQQQEQEQDQQEHMGLGSSSYQQQEGAGH